MITAEAVRDAMVKANITYVPHHECSLCDCMVFYSREGDQLFFNPACDCSSYRSKPEPRPWSDAADWINGQNDEWKAKLLKAFGFP